MTYFSREPPHTNLVLHLAFNSGEVDDHSPQGLGASPTGDPTVDMGFVGTGLKLDGRSEYVTVPHNEQLSSDYYTVFGAFRLSREPRSRVRFVSKRASGGSSTVDIYVDSDGTVGAYVDDGSTSVTLTSDSSAVSAGETHSVALRKGPQRDLILYLDGNQVDSADSTGIGDTTTTTDLFVGRNYNTDADHFPGTVDEIRWYKRALDKRQIVNLHEIGIEHAQTRVLQKEWNTPGIPFRPGRGNALLAGTMAEPVDLIYRELDAIFDAVSIEHSAGKWLELLGSLAGIQRNSGETDAHYRARIKARIAAARSSGTIPDLLDVAASVVDTTVDRIELNTRENTPEGEVEVYVRTADVDASELTASEIDTLLDNAVFAAHRVDAIEQGATPFEVIADGDTNDPDQGLTSDSISTGGGLVSDV